MSSSFARVVVAASGAALISGSLCGGVGRAFMRLFILAGSDTPSFSLTGSLYILVLFVVSVLPGAIASAARTRDRFRLTLYAIGALVPVYSGLVIGIQAWADAIAQDVSVLQGTLLGLLTTGIAIVTLGNPIIAHRLAVQFSEVSRADLSNRSSTELAAHVPPDYTPGTSTPAAAPNVRLRILGVLALVGAAAWLGKVGLIWANGGTSTTGGAVGVLLYVGLAALAGAAMTRAWYLPNSSKVGWRVLSSAVALLALVTAVNLPILLAYVVMGETWLAEEMGIILVALLALSFGIMWIKRNHHGAHHHSQLEQHGR